MDIPKYKRFVSIGVVCSSQDPVTCDVLQIVTLGFDDKGKVHKQLNKYFRPTFDYILSSDAISKGVTYKNIKGMTSYQNQTAGSRVRASCEGYPLVGHGINNFELKFLGFEFVDIPEVFDTADLCSQKYGKRMTLKEACYAENIPVREEFLGAQAIAHLTLELFMSLTRPHGQTTMNMPEPVKEVVVPDIVVEPEPTPVVVNKPEPIVIVEPPKPVKVEEVIPYVPSEYFAGIPRDRPSIVFGDLFVPFDSDEKYHWWKWCNNEDSVERWNELQVLAKENPSLA